ncbi:hypothetical protein B0T22DRAFT_443955 [Podospora appendiculata]|uniref:Uncharacterized protein n=1 Tax=Podospora appendiculata TaxID=314037 RepID=A0AAE0X3I8_9PEZI|nr:hypothetical protein B0T22DRAFT_443955 [Podospora appendiculata]
MSVRTSQRAVLLLLLLLNQETRVASHRIASMLSEGPLPGVFDREEESAKIVTIAVLHIAARWRVPAYALDFAWPGWEGRDAAVPERQIVSTSAASLDESYAFGLEIKYHGGRWNQVLWLCKANDSAGGILCAIWFPTHIHNLQKHPTFFFFS